MSPVDNLLPLKLPPGMRNTGTVYQSKGRWYTGNLVRFFQDTIQPIGGWVARQVSGATMAGVPRAMVSYRRNDDTQIIVIGTTRGLYAISGSVVYDITPAAVVSTVTARVWQLDVFGAYLVAVDLTAPSTAGGAYYWTGDTAVVAAVLAPFSGSNPTLALSVVTTPERFLTVLGAKYTSAGWSSTGVESQSRMVTWATQEGGFTGSEWVPGAANTAGDFTLTTDGALVCGRRTRGGTLLWTTTDLWMMTYIGGSFIYRFDQAGNKCGIISSRAVIVTDAASYWMGINGFYSYDGFVKPLPCDVYDYVFGSLNRTYAHYIWAVEHPTFGEVTWFYPHAAQTEITRYVTYNYREQHWVTGSLGRTAGMTSQPGTAVYPVMCDASRVIYNHETGYFRYPSAAPYLESGPIEIGGGDRWMSVQRIIPDDRTLGDVSMSIYTAPNPDTAETANGPYTLTAETSVRLMARQVRLKITEVAPSDDAVWTARTTPTMARGQTRGGAAWSPALAMFAAVAGQYGANGIMTSPDGITWTQRTANSASQVLYGIIWSPELAMFIAAGWTSGAETTNIFTSTNGTTWTARTVDAGNWQSVAWAASIPLAVAIKSNLSDVATSTNGTAWSVVGTTGFTASAQMIEWSPALGLFVAITNSSDAATQFYTSPNGTTWTVRTGTTGPVPWKIVWATSLAKFVVLSFQGTGAWVSTNGTTWTFTAFSVAGAALQTYALVWAESLGKLFAFGPYAGYLVSDDGVTWTVETGVPEITDEAWVAGAWGSDIGTLAICSTSSAADAAATGVMPERDWRVGVVRLGVLPAGRR